MGGGLALKKKKKPASKTWKTRPSSFFLKERPWWKWGRVGGLGEAVGGGAQGDFFFFKQKTAYEIS